MARKREFDSHKVLQAAAMVFANYGYAGSSIDMLVEKTGLQRGSLYKAFSSKAGLFKAVLEENLRYEDEIVETHHIFVDLLIVAIWERARIDKDVHALVKAALTSIKSKKKSIPDTLYRRMAKRAHLPIELHQYNKEVTW